jgi:hypothetical protein
VGRTIRLRSVEVIQIRVVIEHDQSKHDEIPPELFRVRSCMEEAV